MKEVKGYQTEDGKFFSNQEEAVKHERTVKFKNWYEDGYYDGYLGHDCDDEMLVYFLEQNREVVGKFLGFIK